MNKICIRKAKKTDLPNLIKWWDKEKSWHHDCASAPLILNYNSSTKDIINTLYSNSNLLFIIEKHDREPIGYAILKSIDMSNKSSECGVIIGDERYWNKGYGLFAIVLLLKVAFETLRLHRVYSVTLEEKNDVKKFQKLLGKIEGIYRNAVCINGKYHNLIASSMLKNEYMLALKKNKIVRRILRGRRQCTARQKCV